MQKYTREEFSRMIQEKTGRVLRPEQVPNQGQPVQPVPLTGSQMPRPLVLQVLLKRAQERQANGY